jgi:hypothetical protein
MPHGFTPPGLLPGEAVELYLLGFARIGFEMVLHGR